MKKYLYSLLSVALLFGYGCSSSEDEAGEPVAPVCSITAPEDGATYESDEAIVVKGTGSDEDGTIADVVLKINDAVVESVNAVPFEYTLEEQYKEPGTVKIVLEVTDDQGNAVKDEVSIEILGRVRTFTDSRDNKTYKAVKIGTQLWMGENLAYLPAVMKPSDYSKEEARYYVYGYDGEDVAAAKASTYYESLGVLYNWIAAGGSMDSKNDAIPSGIQGPCPDGWHVPSEAEWEILYNYVRDQIPDDQASTGWGGDTFEKNVSAHLRSQDWPINDADPDTYPQLKDGAFDTYDFCAKISGSMLPGGFYYGPDDNGKDVTFWLPHYDAVTYPSYPGAVTTSFSNYKYEPSYSRGSSPDRGYSVRCLHD